MHRCCVNPVVCKAFTAIVFILFTVLFAGLLVAFAIALRRARPYGEQESPSVNDDQATQLPTPY